MTAVMILDGQQRSALAATRSLGKRGLEVHVADVQVPTLAGSSRYAVSQSCYPDPAHRPDAFVDWVHESAARLNLRVVLPATDLSTMLLAPTQGRTKNLSIACAPADAYERVSNKAALMQLARGIGVRVPQTIAVSTMQEFAEQMQSVAFPLVLKPARSKVRIENEVVATSVHIAQSAEEALNHIRQQKWFGTIPCLLQEYVEGQGAGVFAFYNEGEPVAWFCHKRVREKPPQGGVSVLSESVLASPELRRSAEEILTAARWSGAAMVEFRVSPSGEPYLMEINGRLWGSVQLAIDSGVDFPWMAYEQAIGNPIPAVPRYTTGKRLRWLMGDVDNLLIVLKDSRFGMSRKASAAGRFIGAFADLGANQEILRWTDPRPALFELRSWIRALL